MVIGGVDSEYTPMYLADVKDDGTFTNIRKVEMKGDRYVSAEPIEKAEITPSSANNTAIIRPEKPPMPFFI